MVKSIRIFTYLALLFSSFTIWFSLGAWLRINFFFICVALFFSAINELSKFRSIIVFQKNTDEQRIWMNIFLTFVVASYCYNTMYNWNSKLNSNTLAILFLILLMYYCYSSIVERYISIENGIKWMARGSVLLMSIVFVDSILVNFAHIKIHDLFVWGLEGNTDYFYRGFWISPCAPTAEPGDAGQIMNVLIPFSIYYFKGRKRMIVIALYFFDLFSLFSSTTLLEFLLVPTCLLAFQNRKNKKYAITYIIVFAIGVFLYTRVQGGSSFSSISADWSFIDKVTLSGNTGSDSERQTSWLIAIQDGLTHPIFGRGAGIDKAIVDNRLLIPTYLSTWLAFFAYFGVFAFIAFALFWSTFFRKCLKLNGTFKNMFLFSFICNTINGVVGEYYPVFVFWAVLPFINKAYNENLCKHK